MKITDGLEKFLVQLRADGRSVHTINQYSRHARLLADWMAKENRGRDTVSDLDHEVVARFLSSGAATHRPDGKPKKATATNALRSSIKVFCSYLSKAGYAECDAGRLIKRAVCQPPPPKALSENEQVRFIETLAKAETDIGLRDFMLFDLMLKTGVRLSSALSVEKADVDLTSRHITLHTVKGNREQRVFLGKAICRHLKQYLQGRGGGPLFTDRSGRRLSGRHVQRRLQHWLSEAEIEKRYSPHCLRHTHAKNLYEATSDIALVQASLGHRQIASTMIYARVDERRLRKALA